MRTIASVTRARSRPPTRRRRKKTSRPTPTMFTSDVASGMPQTPTRVEGDVENGVEDERADGDHRRQPVRLQAVEAARHHQHPAVEDEPERERREAAGDDRDVALGERAALVDEAHDRLGEDGRDDRGRDEEEADLAQAGADRWRGSRRGRSAPRDGRGPGTGRSRPRPRTSPAGACRAGTPS